MTSPSLDTGLSQYHDYLGKRWPNAFEFRKKYGEHFRLVGDKEAYRLLGQDGKGGYLQQYAMAVCYPGCDYVTIRWFNPGKNQPKMESPSKKYLPLHAFVPPNLKTEHFDGTLYIAESAMKAMAMCELGYPAISGSGVSGLYTNDGWPRNMPVELMAHCQRIVILWDYDVTHNPDVKDAIVRLQYGIEKDYPGVRVALKTLPNPELLGLDDPKYGFDDFWMHVGTESAVLWMDDETEDRGGLVPLDDTPLGRHIRALNAEYVVCGNPAAIVRRSSGELIKRNDFIQLVEAPRRYRRAKGESAQLVSAAEEWVKSDERQYVEKARYVPGGKEYEPGVFYNKWRDTGVEAVEGDVQFILDMVENMVPDAEVRDLLIKLTAWLVQNPGGRCEKLTVLISHVQSTGKSTYVEMLESCLGKTNVAAVDAMSFAERFNSHFVEKQLVRFDEVNDFPNRAMAKLERYVTETVVDVEEKGYPIYYMDNTMNFFATSNNPGAFHFKDNERRAFIVECTPTTHYPTGSEYWTEFRAQLGDGGLEAWRWYLAHLDLGEFDVRFMPPMTAMKAHMQTSGGNKYEQWVNDLYADREEVLGGAAGRLYFTSMELANLMIGQRASTMDGKHLDEECAKLASALPTKFKQVNKGKQIKIEGVAMRFWSIGGAEECSNAEIRDNYIANKALEVTG